MESLCIRTYYSPTYYYTYYTFIERRSTPTPIPTDTGRRYYQTLGCSGGGGTGLSSYSILEGVLATGMRTASSSLMLISRILLEVLETLLTMERASSSLFGLNILTSDLSKESVGSSSTTFLLTGSRLFFQFLRGGCSALDLVDSVLTKFQTDLGSMFYSLLRLSLCLRERLADLESAVSMAFQRSELLFPMDCLGVCCWMWLREVLDLADCYYTSACRFSSCYFFRSSSYLRRNYYYFLRKAYIKSRSSACACSFFCEDVNFSLSYSSLALRMRSSYICRYNSSRRYLSCSARLAFSRSSSQRCLRRSYSFIRSAFSETTLLNSSSI